MAKKTKRKLKKKVVHNKKNLELTVFLFFASVLIFSFSNFGFLGFIGKYISGAFFALIGTPFYLITLSPILIVIYAKTKNKNRPGLLKKFYITAGIIAIASIFLEMIYNYNATIKQSINNNFFNHKGGGLLGYTLSIAFIRFFSIYGAIIILLIILSFFIMYILDFNLISFAIEYFNGSPKLKQKDQINIDNKIKPKENDNKFKRIEQPNSYDEMIVDLLDEKKISKRERRNTKTSAHLQSLEPVSEDSFKSLGYNRLEEEIDHIQKNDTDQYVVDKETSLTHTPDIYADINNVEKLNKVKCTDLPKDQEINLSAKKIIEPITKLTIEEDVYKFPSINHLAKSNKTKSSDGSKVRELARTLKQTLDSFGVNAEITNISIGPTVTRFEIVPDIGVKVSKIVGLSDDIKLNLAAEEIRIEAPIPGKAAVGIEIPNRDVVTVRLRDILEAQEFKNAKSKLSFAVGLSIEGKPVIGDIQKMPHVLIAGATGSGKSVCINSLIMSILYKAKPDEVKLLMIDPKVVELSIYNGIPHLIVPVVTDPKRAAGSLNWAIAEMDKRYKMFAKKGVKDIFRYNEKISGTEDEKLPQIVIIIDELADLMMVASNEVEYAICRIAQLARACGIHLVIATQRPSVNVITGIIKANIPSRIAFAVSSGVDSRTILDTNGAEKLLGKGDMLYHPAGIPKPVRMQGAFVDEKEIANVVNEISIDQDVTYDKEIEENINNTSFPQDKSNDYDDYFVEAGKIIIDKERASIGLLQRILKIGFNRAARIMDQLFEAGVVGPDEGTKPRKVIMSEEEFNDYVKNNLN